MFSVILKNDTYPNIKYSWFLGLEGGTHFTLSPEFSLEMDEPLEIIPVH